MSITWQDGHSSWATNQGYWHTEPSALLREQGNAPFRGPDSWWTPLGVIYAESSRINEGGTVFTLVLPKTGERRGPFPSLDAAKDSFHGDQHVSSNQA